MTNDSSVKERLKRLVRGSGREDGSSKNGAVSSSATLSQANFVLRPLEQAALSSRATTLVHADTATRNASNSNRARTTGEISQRVAGGQAADITEDLATDRSLWDRAYDTLKDEKHVLIAEYEDLLSRVLIRAQTNTLPTPNETEDVDEVTNQISQHNVIARREKLKEIIELGLKRMEDKKVSATLLGHEIVLQDVVANVAGAVEWAEDYIKDAIKDLPYASIVMAGVSLVLPLLKNPTAVEAANQGGFNYVTSQMRYYVKMESLLLPEEMKLDLKADLTERLVDLYELIIDFQVRSVIRFYRSRTKNFLRGTINYDGWDKNLQDIKDGDKELVLKFEIAISGTNLDLVSKNLQELKRLAREADASRKALNDLLVKVQEHVEISRGQLAVLQNIDQHITDPQNQICLQNLRTTDPRDDKTRIQQTKGGLLQDSYRWVLENAEFQRWRYNEHSRLLWIKGDPGKGKTMLLCGIIDELRKSIGNTGLLSFFFCQATDSRINSATAVMRGLMYLLAENQPSLLSHIRKKYDHAGSELFKDANAWVALSEILTTMLEDLNLQSTWLIIDALDECVTDLPNLLNFIVHNSSAYLHVKWIVSSRNWPDIEDFLDTATRKVRLQLELNAKSISAAVHTYILLKVKQLAEQKKYGDDTRIAVQHHLLSNANDTFLWVALVCQELARPEVRRRHTLAKLRAFPPGLDHLYRRMMNQICDSEDAELCKRILAVVSIVYRPVTLDELACFINMSDGVFDDESLTEIIGLCGSFLTLRERTISFVHQSAKDFLVEQASKEIFPSGIEDVHYTIFSRSLQVMSRTLRRDVYSLGAPGISIDQVKQPDLDPLAAARYSCLYWVDHLLDYNTRGNANNDLKDGGSVDKFLCQYYLYWLEALSLIRSLSNGVVMVRKLENWLQVARHLHL
ncbi:hypothetical protein G7Y89_g1706 [Cudoniella acicularis]|uniref:NACHT domain-containing protein n=1 Tax=Cudoniella acicularis TaxID=354080 RepID=A0A8H4RUS6_9HELO|nr:hypothetical protein G7Y89_g1706 [Cudoniella acicularis]